jgi:hypothetical protein
MNVKCTNDNLTKFYLKTDVSDEMKTHSEQLSGMLAQSPAT